MFDSFIKFIDGTEERLIRKYVEEVNCLLSFKEKITELQGELMKLTAMKR